MTDMLGTVMTQTDLFLPHRRLGRLRTESNVVPRNADDHVAYDLFDVSVVLLYTLRPNRHTLCLHMNCLSIFATM